MSDKYEYLRDMAKHDGPLDVIIAELLRERDALAEAINDALEGRPIDGSDMRSDDGLLDYPDVQWIKERLLQVMPRTIAGHEVRVPNPQTHDHEYLRGGKMEESWIQPICSCGWSGDKHYAYSSYQHSNARIQLARHFSDVKKAKRQEGV